MRCPTCGSPARIRGDGDSWECGWCGDSGMFYTPRKKVKEVKAPAPQKPKPNTGELFRYCTVSLGFCGENYSYLTGTLDLTPGDWVEVPWGKGNIIRIGQIVEVKNYTRSAAPWPPERTKTVLRKATEPKEDIQDIQLEEQYPEEPVVINEPPQKYGQKAVFVLLACLMLGGIIGGFYLHWNDLYQKSVAFLEQGNYAAVSQIIDSVPSMIHEQPTVLCLAQAGILLEQGNETSLRDGLALLEKNNPGSFSEQHQQLYSELKLALRDTLYQEAVSALEVGNHNRASALLAEVGDYQDSVILKTYIVALQNRSIYSDSLERALSALQTIPKDYDGPCAADIQELRSVLPTLITQMKTREAEDARIAAEAARRAEEIRRQEQETKPAEKVQPSRWPLVGNSDDRDPRDASFYSSGEAFYWANEGEFNDMDEAIQYWESHN